MEIFVLFIYACAIFGFLSLGSYALTLILQSWLSERNFKDVYGAEWAMVTGASSGIGKAIVHKLAGQDINVVIVALEDGMLRDAEKEFSQKYPQVKFRVVGCDLGGNDFMQSIHEICSDINIDLLFCNAGYILPGIFSMKNIGAQLNNFHCNARSSVELTHFYLNQLKPTRNSNGKKGLISYTSSSAGFLPSPIATMYGATKAFLTTFAAGIAAEVKEDGIDVVCIHPSPIASNFFAPAKDISLFSAVQKAAQSPEVIVKEIFRNAGRFSIVDQGSVTVGTRILLKLIDWNAIAELAPLFLKYNADFRSMKSQVALKEE